jgi:hypothetical protein
LGANERWGGGETWFEGGGEEEGDEVGEEGFLRKGGYVEVRFLREERVRGNF